MKKIVFLTLLILSFSSCDKEDFLIAEAHDDFVETTEGNPVEIDVLANDLGRDIGIHGIISYPDFGTLSVGNGKITYKPNANYVGNDSFSYEISDVLNNKSVANVDIVIKQ